jgi:DNA-binding MarR family transcriptional regulator
MKRAAAKTLELESDPFDDLLGYHLRRLSVAVMADFGQALAPLGLKAADASILFMIEANPAITQSDVGKALGILRANMAPLIANLLSRGLIEREPADGRSHALRLSSTGEDLCLRAKRAATAHEDRFFRTLSKGARTRMISQLRALWMEKKP